MANTAYPPVLWVHFVILVAGRAFLDANPACVGTLKVAYKGNLISDPKIKLDCDILLIRQFLTDHRLPSDASITSLTRIMHTICPIKFPQRKTTSKSVKDLVRANLDKYNKILNGRSLRQGDKIDDYSNPKAKHTRDDSDLLTRRSMIFRTKALAQQLRPGTRGTDPNMAAEPRETEIKMDIKQDKVRTDIGLDDSFGQAMGNLNSQVLSPDQLDTTINELGTRSYAKVATSPGKNSPALANRTPVPGTGKRKHDKSNSSISDTSTDAPGVRNVKKRSRPVPQIPVIWGPMRGNQVKLRQVKRCVTISQLAGEEIEKMKKIETHKLSLAQREATPNKDKPCPKRDLSPGTPDSDLASPERKQPVISKFKLDFTDSDIDTSSSISVHSSDFDSDMCSKLEKDLTEALTTSQADDGGVTAATADVTSSMPDINAPIKTSTPARPIIQDTVPCPLTPLTSTIIDLDEFDTDLHESPEPAPPIILDQDIPSTTRPLASPLIQDVVPNTRDNSASHPQNISMTEINDISNDKAGTPNVAVADDDVAVPDMAPTAGPNPPRAKPVINKDNTLSGNTPTPVPGRANQDLHWRSKINRDITKAKYAASAKANLHSPGKGPSHSEGVSLSQMTDSQTLARTIEISKVDKGKDRAFTPASPDSDSEPTPPIPKTAPKTAKKPQNKSTKSTTPTATGATKPQGNSTAGTQGKKPNGTKKPHQFPAFFIPPARLVNGLKAQHFFEAVICHHSWFKVNPNAISIKTISSGRQIIVPNSQEAANALKCPLRYGTSENTIILNMVGGHSVNTQKFTIKGLDWKITPFDVAQDPRVAKCSVMCAPDNKTWTAVIHCTANIDSMVIKNKHYKPAEVTTKSKRCTKCQKHGHQKFQCKSKTPICAFCAGTHESDRCYRDIMAGKTVVRKCANCGGHHPASSKQCIKYLQINGYIPAPPPVVNPWGNTPRPDAPTPAARNQDPLPTPPTEPEARQYDGPLYTEQQKRHIDYVACKINRSINKYQCNRFIPNDLAREIILGKSRYPPQIR